MKNRIGSALCFRRQDSTGTTKAVWDQENVIAETDDADSTQVVYTLEPLNYGNLISQKRGANTSYHLFDALGSTDRLTDGSATVTDNYVYECFGTVKASSGSTTNPYKYVGQAGYYDDPDLLEQYVRARWYDPALARWLSEDPVGQRADLNLYWYGQNSPQNMTDPSGAVPVAVPLCLGCLAYVGLLIDIAAGTCTEDHANQFYGGSFPLCLIGEFEKAESDMPWYTRASSVAACVACGGVTGAAKEGLRKAAARLAARRAARQAGKRQPPPPPPPPQPPACDRITLCRRAWVFCQAFCLLAALSDEILITPRSRSVAATAG